MESYSNPQDSKDDEESLQFNSFVNYDDAKEAQDGFDIDKEKKTENYEMTEMEIESLTQILNEKEVCFTNIDQI